MKYGLINGVYTSPVNGLGNGNQLGISTGLLNGIYDENLLTIGIVRDGLVLHLDASQNLSYVRSGTEWNDLTANRNNGTLINGPTFNSGNGGSIVFDGVNDFCQLPNTITLAAFSGDFAFSCWIYPIFWPTGSNSWSPIFVTAITNGMWIGKNETGQFILRRFGVADILQFNTLPTLNRWTLVTITRIGTTATLYYNGVSQTSTTTNHNFVQATTYIGNDVGSGSFALYYTGRISNLLFYKNKGLTSAEVLQNYNATKSRFGLL